MRIATLRSNGTFEAESLSAPDTLLSDSGVPNTPSNTRSGAVIGAPYAAAGRAAVLGLLFLGLVACQGGSEAESAVANAASEASDAAAAVAETASAGDAGGETAQTGDGAASGGAAGLDSDQQKASYAIGYSVIRPATSQFPDAIDHEAFVAGVRAQLEGRESEVSQDDARRTITALTETQQAKQALAGTTAAKEGAKFLADNASVEGVVTTATGLQYMVLKEGDGPKPVATDTVKTHYEGSFINGEVFDSSLARGEPTTFPLNGVIRGWTEALQLMNTGSKYRLFIPPELAYGNQPPPSIPPQSTLIFEVELIEILGGDAS